MPRMLMPFGSPRLPGFMGDPFLDLHREVNRLFDDVMRGAPGRGTVGAAAVSPRLDVHETSNGIEVTAELPGCAQDDLDIRLEHDVLEISGEKRSERQDEKGLLAERSYGAFSRAIRLPFEPDPSQAQASFENGVLRILLPRAPKPERTRRIEVKGGGRGGTRIEGRGDQPGGAAGAPIVGGGAASGHAEDENGEDASATEPAERKDPLSMTPEQTAAKAGSAGDGGTI